MSHYPGQRTQSATLSSCHPHLPLCRSSLAVFLAILGVPLDDVVAEGCDRRTTVLGGSSHTACNLDNGEQLQIERGAELRVPGAPAVTVSPGATARQVLNSGVISGGRGLVVADASLSGNVFNSQTGVIEGAEAVMHIVDSTVGSFANAGRLSLAGGPGVDLPAVLIENSTLNGDINNTGTLEVINEAAYTAMYINRSHIKGDIKLSGVINGYYNGLVIEQTSVDGSFRNSGTLNGGASISVSNSSFGGDFVNSAEIGSTFVLASVHIGGNFINTGDIDGGDFAGIRDSQIVGDVINTGTFEAGSGASIRADIGGCLVNTGVLSGGAYAFGISGDIRGGIYNSGVITGGGDSASALSVGAHTPMMINTGTISGYSQGLRIGDGAQIGMLINSGTISQDYDFSGDETSLEINEGAQVGLVQIAGGTARFEGPVRAPSVPFFVTPKATYRLLPNDVFQVRALTNQGTLVLAAPKDDATSAPIIIGDFNQAADGVLRTEILDTMHYGRLVVTATATLPAQARIDIDLSQASQPLAPAQLQDVLSAGTLVSDGSFSVSSNSALFDFAAVKDGNSVDLILTARSPQGVQQAAQAAQLGEAASAAAVIDRQLAKASDSALTPYFATATSTKAVASALAASLPTGNQALRASQGALVSINRAVDQRLSSLSPAALARHGTTPLWAQPFSYSSASHRSSTQAEGTVLGMDTQVGPDNRVGFAFAYAQGSAAAQGIRGQGSELDLWQFLAYGRHALGPRTDVQVYAGAGNNRVRSERAFAISGINGMANADYDAFIATLGTRLGRDLELSQATRFRPSVRLDYNHVHEGAYRERGSAALQPLLLQVDERDSDQLVAGVDALVEHALSPLADLRLDLGLGYDLLHRVPATTAAYAAAPTDRFTVNNRGSSPWQATASLGLVTHWANGNNLSLSHEVQQRSDFKQQVTAVKLVVPF